MILLSFGGPEGPLGTPLVADFADLTDFLTPPTGALTDYFTNNNGGTTMMDANGTTNGNAQPAATGGEDLGMDEISVSSSVEFVT